MQNLLPAPGYLLIASEEVKSTIEVISEENPTYARAKVLRVGADQYMDNGNYLTAPCKIGDSISYIVSGNPKEKTKVIRFSAVVGVYE